LGKFISPCKLVEQVANGEYGGKFGEKYESGAKLLNLNQARRGSFGVSKVSMGETCNGNGNGKEIIVKTEDGVGEEGGKIKCGIRIKNKHKGSAGVKDDGLLGKREALMDINDILMCDLAGAESFETSEKKEQVMGSDFQRKANFTRNCPSGGENLEKEFGMLFERKILKIGSQQDKSNKVSIEKLQSSTDNLNPDGPKDVLTNLKPQNPPQTAVGKSIYQEELKKPRGYSL
jgi:hypothetical protein